MSLDSKVLFARKATEYGLKEPTLAKMTAKGWVTLGSFAFACSATPNSDGGSNAFEREVATPLLGPEKPAEGEEPAAARAELPGLRRLHFEAWMTATAELKHRLERRDDDPPRRLPAVEREERKAELATTLGEGLKLSGEYEPSDGLIDLAVEICEGEVVRRIPWEKCTAKQAEIEGEKTIQSLKEDRDGFIRLQTSSSKPLADTSSLLRLSDALSRRGAALDIGRVVSWRVHQELTHQIMGALKRDPPAGMARVTVEQAKAYDVELWRRVAELAAGRVKPDAEGNKPLDKWLRQAMTEPLVAMIMMPRHGGRDSTAGSSKDDSRTKQLENQLAQLRQQMSGMKRNQSQPAGGKGAGKGKGNSNGSQGSQPGNKKQRSQGLKIKGLEGMPTRTQRSNKPICFGYNLGTCSNAAAGGTCDKGVHVCGGCGDAGCTWPNCPRRK